MWILKHQFCKYRRNINQNNAYGIQGYDQYMTWDVSWTCICTENEDKFHKLGTIKTSNFFFNYNAWSSILDCLVGGN